MRSGEYTSHRPQGRGTFAPRLLVRFCPVGAVVAFDFGVTVEGRDQRLRLRRRSQFDVRISWLLTSFPYTS